HPGRGGGQVLDDLVCFGFRGHPGAVRVPGALDPGRLERASRQCLDLALAGSLLPGPIALDGDLVPGRAAALLAELCENLLGERWIRLPRVHPAEILGLRLTGGVERLAGVESLVGRAVEVQTPGV